MANDIGGVWRTIGGRRVFIKDGQDLASAMRESGKFKTSKKDKEKLEKFAKENGQDLKKIEKETDELINENDYAVYKKAKLDPDSINPMTEYSTDWEALDKQYKDRFEKEGLKAFKEKFEEYQKSLYDEDGTFHDNDTKETLKLGEELRKLEKDYELKGKDIAPIQQEIVQKYDKINADKLDNGKPYKSMEQAKKEAFGDNNEIRQNKPIEPVEDRLKNNMIVSHYGNHVAYRDKDNNLIVTGRENYNDYVNGKKDRLGGEFVTNDNDALKTMIGYEGLDKYPYEGATRDEKTGNGKKWKDFVDTEYNRLKDKVIDTTNAREERAKTNENYRDTKTSSETRKTTGRQEIKNASPSQIEKGDLIGPKHLLVTAIRPASVEKDGYSSGYSVTTKDSNGNTSRQIISESARNTIYKKQSTNETMNDSIRNAYNDYKKKHPNTKLSFTNFKDNYK